jgi:hypothetical protein
MANLDPQKCPNGSEGAILLFLLVFPLIVKGAESALLQDTEGEEKKTNKNSVLALTKVISRDNLDISRDNYRNAVFEWTTKSSR